jgi:hypothetical protein
MRRWSGFANVCRSCRGHDRVIIFNVRAFSESRIVDGAAQLRELEVGSQEPPPPPESKGRVLFNRGLLGATQ